MLYNFHYAKRRCTWVTCVCHHNERRISYTILDYLEDCSKRNLKNYESAWI